MRALYPGVFDPPTLGHLDIIQRASLLYSSLIVGITENRSLKKPILSVEDRAMLLRKCTTHLKNVEIVHFSSLTVEFCKQRQIDVMIRALRTSADFAHEFSLASANRQMAGVETCFLLASPCYSHISSSLVREIAFSGGRLHHFVPDDIEEFVFEKLNQSPRKG